MPRLILRPHQTPRQRRGVTLAELLVAFFLLAVIGTSLVRVFTKQQQAYKDLTLAARAKRELRMGASLLPMELRSISSSGGDIITMSESEMEVRAFIGTSIICEREWASTGGNAKQFKVPPLNLANHKLTTFFTRPTQGDLVFLFDDGPTAGAVDDSWAMRTINAAPGNTKTACPGAPFTDPVADVNEDRFSFVVDVDLPDSVRIGAAVRFARPVRYKIYQVASGNWYLGLQEFTGGAWGGMEPLAGPFRPFQANDNAATGLQFRYYDTLGVRITDLTKTKDVGRVDVYLRTDAGPSAITERHGAPLRDSVVMRVAIRNSK